MCIPTDDCESMKSDEPKGNDMKKDIRRKKVFTDAEKAMKSVGWRVQSLGKLQYVVIDKDGQRISPVFSSLYQLCQWVNEGSYS